jgi:hypothetical protein
MTDCESLATRQYRRKPMNKGKKDWIASLRLAMTADGGFFVIL